MPLWTNVASSMYIALQKCKQTKIKMHLGVYWQWIVGLCWMQEFHSPKERDSVQNVFPKSEFEIAMQGDSDGVNTSEVGRGRTDSNLF